MTLILVSEMDQVKYPKRFARMLSPETGGETPANKPPDAGPPTLRHPVRTDHAVLHRPRGYFFFGYLQYPEAGGSSALRKGLDARCPYHPTKVSKTSLLASGVV